MLMSMFGLWTRILAMVSKPNLMAAIRGVSVYPCTGIKIELETNGMRRFTITEKLVGTFSVILKPRVIFGNLRFKL